MNNCNDNQELESILYKELVSYKDNLHDLSHIICRNLPKWAIHRLISNLERKNKMVKIKGYNTYLKEGHAVAFDFDGVIHKYSKGWQDGSIYDGVNADVLDIINTLMMNNIPCVIMSTRDPQQIKDWWDKQWFSRGIKTKVLDFNTVFYNNCDCVGITNRKIAAQLYIDDRAYRYTGESIDTFLFNLTN